MNDYASSTVLEFGEEQPLSNAPTEVELVFDSTDGISSLRADEVLLDGIDGGGGSDENDASDVVVTSSYASTPDYEAQLENIEKLLVYNDLLLIVICVSIFLAVGIRLGADLTRWFTAR